MAFSSVLAVNRDGMSVDLVPQWQGNQGLRDSNI